MSLTASFRELPGSTLVKAYGINGDLILAWDCRSTTNLEVASLALAIRTSAILNVPRKSVHCVWTAPEALQPQTENPDNTAKRGPSFKANVKIIISPMKYSPSPDFGNVLTCNCCTDPCSDADDNTLMHPAPRTAWENCSVCEPCFLCADCRTETRPGEWKCFMCLCSTEIESLGVSQKRRFLLTLPNFYDSISEPDYSEVD